ncbi:MAG: peptidase U32 family protein [Adlercreutzia equolifaciens]
MPTGGMELLRAAVQFGADAVYLAADRFGMRARAANFRLDEIPAAVAFAHDHGVKVHVACNILMHPGDIDELPAFFRAMDAAGVDAFIIGDLGAFAVAGEVAPRVERHVSTQASVANAAAARVWHSLGASRVVCAREMSLADIARLRQTRRPIWRYGLSPTGAMRVAVSGRCLISSYLTGRSGNKGHCTQPCRWSYQLGTAAFEEFAPPEAPAGFLLEEEKRPGEFFPIEEDDRGTFIMNAKDMNMLAHLRELARVGVDSIKIEGRNKKAFYVASVVGAYRRVLDGEPPAAVADELLAVSHRPYGTGFYFSEAEQAPAYDGYEQETMHVADVAACRDGFLYVLCRNRFAEGDELRSSRCTNRAVRSSCAICTGFPSSVPTITTRTPPLLRGRPFARYQAADWEAPPRPTAPATSTGIRMAAASDGAASDASDRSSASDMRDASNVSVVPDMRDASNVSVVSGYVRRLVACATRTLLSAHVPEGSFLRKRTFRRSARHG